LALLERMQRAQDDLHRLYEEVREYAAPLQLNLCVCRPAEVWREAWADVGRLREGTGAELREETGDGDWQCLADRFYLRQVFRNVLENALAAGGDPPRVEIRCSAATSDGQATLRVAVRDNGTGFTPEQR